MGDIRDPIFCGPHRVRSERNLMIVDFIGTLVLSDFLQISALADRVIAEQGGIYLLANVERAAGIDAVARRAIVMWMRTERVHGIANIKASMLSRALAALLANAIRLVSGIHCQIAFVSTEIEARLWAAELERRRLHHLGA